MPYQVEQLIQGTSKPITITKDETITKALSIMVQNDFSQLPVVSKGVNWEKVEGMITYESVIHAIRNFGSSIEKLQVRHAIVAAPLYNEEDDLFDILDRLKATNVVFVLGRDNALSGIVTSYDTAEYFRSRTEDMMWIEDIEEMIKEFIKFYHADENGELSEQKVDELIQKSLPYYLKENGYKGKKKTFKDLTLNDFIMVLTAKDTWSFYEPIFCMDRVPVIDLLHGVRDIRNDVAHFRGEIPVEDRDKLKFVADWLSRCQEEYAQKKEEELTQKAWESSAAGESGQQGVDKSLEPVAPAPTEQSGYGAAETDKGGSRYSPLADWLQSQPGGKDHVQLSFKEVEEIIGGELPASARSHRAWWANDAVGHTQSIQWLEAGWRSTSVNMTEGRVTFSRILEREKAYIDFFSRIIDDLKKKADFPINNASPDGTSWITVQRVPEAGSYAGYFTFAFTRGKRFRVELYLDMYDQDLTKAVFDRLHAQKEQIEALLGPLTWERLDEKRASRIAKYRDGHILETKKYHELRKWAVDTMIQFYHALAEPAEQIINEVRGA